MEVLLQGCEMLAGVRVEKTTQACLYHHCRSLQRPLLIECGCVCVYIFLYICIYLSNKIFWHLWQSFLLLLPCVSLGSCPSVGLKI